MGSATGSVACAAKVYGKELLLIEKNSGELPLSYPDCWGEDSIDFGSEISAFAVPIRADLLKQDSDSLQLQFQDFSEFWLML